jgi:hypothetical protein
MGAIFSLRMRQKIRKEWGFHTALAIASSALVLILSIDYLSSEGVKAAKATKAKTEITMLCTGILAYETEYDVPPTTNKNAALVKILTGDNQRRIAFLSLSPREMNTHGEMIDPWGQPFLISLADPQHPQVYSVSPDFYTDMSR